MSPRVVPALALVGVALGFGVAYNPLLTAVAAVGLAVLWVGSSWPTVPIVLMFGGMLMDRAGVTGAKVGDFPVTASKLSVLAALAMWTLHCVRFDARAVRWHPVLSGLVGVVLTTAVCVAVANSMADGKFDLYGLAMMTVMVGLVYVSLAETPLDRLYLLLAGLFTLVLLTAILRRGDAIAGRTSGTMGDPNEWAVMVMLVSATLLGGLADAPGWDGRALRMAIFVLSPLAILKSESRAALAVFLLTSPAWLWLMRRNRSELLACLGGAVVGAPVLLDLDSALSRARQLVERLQGRAVEHDPSLHERTELFRQGVALFQRHWFIGAGPGNFSKATGFVSETGELRPAHNTYLEIASEQGIVGLAAFFVLGLLVARTLWRALDADPDPVRRNRVIGVAVGLGSFALMMATLGLLTFAMAYLILGLALAVTHQSEAAHA